MEQYISKADVVAEIERLREGHTSKQYCDEAALVLEELEDFIDTLEMKEAEEVDFEEVFNDEYSRFSNDTDAMDYAFPIDLADYRDFAKHFFKLGLKAKGE